jgi:hypothetical protein
MSDSISNMTRLSFCLLETNKKCAKFRESSPTLLCKAYVDSSSNHFG